MNIILLCSDAPAVGKSTTAKALLQEIPRSSLQPFALPIKQIAYDLYLSVMTHFGIDPEMSFEEFRQTRKEDLLDHVFKTSPRDVYCTLSLYLSSITSDTVWGDLAAVRIKNLGDDIETVIIDDWRRPIEMEVLRSVGSFNLIPVFLKKEGVVPYVGTEATEAFEGNIKPEDCLLTFTFKEDWSNSQELITILKSYIEEISSHG